MKNNVIALFGEVLADKFLDRHVLGGAPYNVARHLQAFNQHPVLITRTGDDPLRYELLDEMSRLNMDSSGVQCDPHYPTGQVVVHMEKDKHRFEIVPDQAYDHIDADEIQQILKTACPQMLYYGTLAQRNEESRQALDTFLSNTRSPRFLDLNLREPWYDPETIRRALTKTDVLKLNQDELNIVARLLGVANADSTHQGLHLMKQFNLNLLLVTCDAEGAWSLSVDGTLIRSKGQQLSGEIVDTVGAGDGFSAICMMGILAGWPTNLTLDRANAFATAICRIRGAAPQQQDFYLAFKEDWKI